MGTGTRLLNHRSKKARTPRASESCGGDASYRVTAGVRTGNHYNQCQLKNTQQSVSNSLQNVSFSHFQCYLQLSLAEKLKTIDFFSVSFNALEKHI